MAERTFSLTNDERGFIHMDTFEVAFQDHEAMKFTDCIVLMPVGGGNIIVITRDWKMYTIASGATIWFMSLPAREQGVWINENLPAPRLG